MTTKHLDTIIKLRKEGFTISQTANTERGHLNYNSVKYWYEVLDYLEGKIKIDTIKFKDLEQY